MGFLLHQNKQLPITTTTIITPTIRMTIPRLLSLSAVVAGFLGVVVVAGFAGVAGVAGVGEGSTSCITGLTG